MGKKEEKSHGRGFVTCNIPLYMCPNCPKCCLKIVNGYVQWLSKSSEWTLQNHKKISLFPANSRVSPATAGYLCGYVLSKMADMRWRDHAFC